MNDNVYVWGMEKKQEQYTMMITDVLGEMIRENDYVLDEENVTEFFHAMANLAPTFIYNKLTDENANILDFNHIANKLCFQFLEK